MQSVKQLGFTLIELMIAIALGLLIVAAATHLFITGIYSVNLQKAMADIQDSANFGINFIASDLRKINYNADKPVITSQTNFGGLILGENNFPTELNNKPNAALISKSASESSSGQITDTASDQLTVQYYADATTFDCEGTTIQAGTMIVQRYYIDAGKLRCDAGHYLKNKPIEKDENGVLKPYQFSGLGSNSQVLMQNVEYMRVLLAVSIDKPTTDNTSTDPIPADNIVQKDFRYIAIEDYPTAAPFPRVRGVQLGILVRANDSVNANKELKAKNESTFKILDQEVKLKTTDSKYLRQVITQTIAFRNALGASS